MFSVSRHTFLPLNCPLFLILLYIIEKSFSTEFFAFYAKSQKSLLPQGVTYYPPYCICCYICPRTAQTCGQFSFCGELPYIYVLKYISTFPPRNLGNNKARNKGRYHFLRNRRFVLRNVSQIILCSQKNIAA